LDPRVGIGYDVHRLIVGRRLVLGGLEIPSAKGLAGHSDGDCLIHAIVDALLGASGLGDIGQRFSDTDPRYEGISSLKLLDEVVDTLKRKGLEISNLDSVIVAESPRLAPYLPRMKRILGPALGLEEDGLGIKAKTNEGLGPIGKGQAIACWAVVAVRRRTKRCGKKA
jgi:2-C-methyl-D-erythritol 2,4-cyclodiphosphate synthase